MKESLPWCECGTNPEVRRSRSDWTRDLFQMEMAISQGNLSYTPLRAVGVDAPCCLHLSFGAFAVDTEESAREGNFEKKANACARLVLEQA